MEGSETETEPGTEHRTELHNKFTTEAGFPLRFHDTVAVGIVQQHDALSLVID